MLDNFSEREILIALGGIVFLVVLFDGWRRMRMASRNKIRVSKAVHKSIATRHDDDYNPELPGGGARIIGEASMTPATDTSKGEEVSISSVSAENVAVSRAGEESIPDVESEDFIESEEAWQQSMASEAGDTYPVEPEPEPEPKVSESNEDNVLTDYSVGDSFWDEPVNSASAVDMAMEQSQHDDAVMDHSVVDTISEDEVTDQVVEPAQMTYTNEIVESEPESESEPEPEPEPEQEQEQEQELHSATQTGDTLDVAPTSYRPKAAKPLQPDDQLSFAMDAPDDWALESFSAEARFDQEDDDSTLEDLPAEPAKVAANSALSNAGTDKQSSSKKPKLGFLNVIKDMFNSEGSEKTPAGEPESSRYDGPVEVLVIHIMARKGYVIEGSALREAFLANGMRLGDQNIFHRMGTIEDMPMFSCANAVKPGIFDLHTMDEMTTPGVSVFMQMPYGEESMFAFEEMAIAAGNIAARLGAELQDDTRSVMTKQTLEHYRQKVVEFERRRRMRLV